MRVGILGAGLIGASIAKAATSAGAATEIVVYDRAAGHAEAVATACRQGRTVPEPGMLGGCDIVFVCTPVDAIADYVRMLASSQAVVIDTGSVKASIVRDLARDGRPFPNFVPGHPLGGGLSSGPDEADGANVLSRPFVLTPHADTSPQALATAQAFLARMGATVQVMEADLHDRLLALTSHLPHLVAFGLVQLLEELGDEERTLAEALAPKSFRTMSRFAQSGAEIWEDIFQHNQAETSAAAKALDRAMRDILGSERLGGRLETLSAARGRLGPRSDRDS